MRHQSTAILITAISLTALAMAPSRTIAQENGNAEIAEKIVRLSNDYRVASGLKKLAVNKSLTNAASDFAKYMLANEKYGHRADGRQPAERAEIAGYKYCVVRENIAYRVDPDQPSSSAVAEDFFDGWKESEEHRENLLAEHISEIGVAVASDDGTTFYAVQMFGRPESAKFKVEIENQTTSDQVIQFRTGDSRDDISLPPGTVLTVSRCIPFSISMESGGKRFDVNEAGRFAITQPTGGKIELSKK